MARASWWNTNTTRKSRIANVSRPSAGEDAATNNIGPVTVLHDRVPVQAEWEEAGQIHSQLSRTSAASRFSRGPQDPWRLPGSTTIAGAFRAGRGLDDTARVSCRRWAAVIRPYSR